MNDIRQNHARYFAERWLGEGPEVHHLGVLGGQVVSNGLWPTGWPGFEGQWYL